MVSLSHAVSHLRSNTCLVSSPRSVYSPIILLPTLKLLLSGHVVLHRVACMQPLDVAATSS